MKGNQVGFHLSGNYGAGVSYGAGVRSWRPADGTLGTGGTQWQDRLVQLVGVSNLGSWCEVKLSASPRVKQWKQKPVWAPLKSN